VEKEPFDVMLARLHKRLDEDASMFYDIASRAVALKPIMSMLIGDLVQGNVDFPVSISNTTNTIWLSTDSHEHALDLCRVFGKYVGFRWKREIEPFADDKLKFTGEKQPNWNGTEYTLQISNVPVGPSCRVEYTETQETRIVKKAKIVCDDPEKKLGDPVVTTPST
jgi:hypothetical protein